MRHGKSLSFFVITTIVAMSLQLDVTAHAQNARALAIQQRICLRRPKACPLKNAASSSSSTSTAFSRFISPTVHRSGGGGSGGNRTSSSSSSLMAPTLTLGAITKNFNDPTFRIAASSDSRGYITYAISNPSVATIAANAVTLVAAGTTTITVMQQAADRFAAATLSVTLTVNTIAPTIIPIITLTKTTTDPPFVLSDPTSNSAGAFTFTSTNPSVATIAGRTVTIVGAGSTTIIFTQAASGNYKSGSASTVLTVNQDLSEA